MDISLSSRFSSTHSFGQHRSVHVLVTGSLLSLGRRVVMDVVGNEQTVLATALDPLYACSAEWGSALPGVVRLVNGVTLAHSNGGEHTIPQSFLDPENVNKHNTRSQFCTNTRPCCFLHHPEALATVWHLAGALATKISTGQH